MAEQENRFSGMSREELERESKKQIAHSALLALAALIVIAVSCYAWFSNNSRVTLGSLLLGMSNQGFDLASAGKYAAEPTDWTLPPEFGVLQEGETLPPEYELPENAPAQRSWTGGAQLVPWRTDSTIHFQDDSENGVGPGGSGEMTFYVIPRQDGDMTIRFRMELLLVDDNKKQIENETTVKLLHGHLLFAFTAGSQTVYYSVNDDGYTLNFPNAKQGVPIEVKANWCWPNTWAEAKESDFFAPLLAEMEEGNKFDWVFYEPNSTTPPKYTDYVNNEGTADDAQLSELYNAADRYISGEGQLTSVASIGLKLTADKIS